MLLEGMGAVVERQQDGRLVIRPAETKAGTPKRVWFEAALVRGLMRCRAGYCSRSGRPATSKAIGALARGIMADAASRRWNSVSFIAGAVMA